MLLIVSVADVSFNGASGSLVAAFNIAEGSELTGVETADPAKWTARFGNVGYLGVSFELVAFNQLLVNMTQTGANAGANVLNYSNAPSDISDSLGRQLGAFGGFPL